MPTLRAVEAISSWRLRAIFDGAASLVAADYAIARVDSGPGAPSVSSAFLPFAAATNVVDLALNVPLFETIPYTLTHGAVSLGVAFYRPVTTRAATPQDDDPEAEALGIDLAWIDGDPDPAGDCPERRGIECYRHDIAHRSVLDPGDLVQAPEAGGGLQQRINGTNSDEELQEDAARLEAEIRNDPRTDLVQVDPIPDFSEQDPALGVRVKPIAIDSFLSVELTRG